MSACGKCGHDGGKHWLHAPESADQWNCEHPGCDCRRFVSAGEEIARLRAALAAAERERDEWEKTAGQMSDRAAKSWGRSEEAAASLEEARAMNRAFVKSASVLALEMRKERDEARAVLRECEWDDTDECPVCWNWQPKHAPDCRLAAALKGAP